MLNAFLTENTLAGFLFLLIAGAAAWCGIITAALAAAGQLHAVPLEARASMATLLALLTLAAWAAGSM